MFAFSWYHGKVTREHAEQMMTPRENGLFLVREARNNPGDYTLDVSFDGKVEHYRVLRQNNQLTIDEASFFENMVELVEVRCARLVLT